MQAGVGMAAGQGCDGHKQSMCMAGHSSLGASTFSRSQSHLFPASAAGGAEQKSCSVIAIS